MPKANSTPKISAFASWAYSLAWLPALPFLPFFPALRAGFWQRIRPSGLDAGVDLWLQAASAGEAALARELIQNWPQDKPASILASSNTPQGLQILQEVEPPEQVSLQSIYFPFDAPWIMDLVLHRLRPQVVALVETELWPGLLQACRKKGQKTMVLNSRMGSRSLARYLFLFQSLGLGSAPRRILAQSPKDADRFRLLFPQSQIEQVPNLKFDRSLSAEFLPYVQNPLSSLFKPSSPVAVLGSVRKQEEASMLRVLQGLLTERPRCIPVLAPRHMQRLPIWKDQLENSGLPWVLRSQLQESPAAGQIILWDRFGELQQLYALARAVYVGGSLVPLGGQNFLEPLAQGVSPCIGPFWENFAWAGEEIVDCGLVQEVQSEQELVQCLLQGLRQSRPRESVLAQFQEYVQARQGGLQKTLQALLQEISIVN
ncbi:MAG: 3-deoxy-D-manno-octulosonic acid transferase [Thermodesulfobacteriota bacterium]